MSSFTISFIFLFPKYSKNSVNSGEKVERGNMPGHLLEVACLKVGNKGDRRESRNPRLQAINLSQ